MYPCLTQPDAAARIRGDSTNPCLSGRVSFFQKANGVLVIARLSGLPRSDTGFFALHIHEGRSCAGDGFSDTGGHFNPTRALHPEHAGDLPPLLSCGGEAYLAVLSDRIRISDIVGRTIVVHSDADDFRSQPAGNAGTKIACGLICRE